MSTEMIVVWLNGFLTALNHSLLNEVYRRKDTGGLSVWESAASRIFSFRPQRDAEFGHVGEANGRTNNCMLVEWSSKYDVGMIDVEILVGRVEGGE